MTSAGGNSDRRLRGSEAFILCAALLVFSDAPSALADWPQWGGPTRDFRVAVSGLSTDWPEGGPEQRWRRDLGDGYSSIAVSGNTLFTMYAKEGQECAIALKAADGSTVWEHCYDVDLPRGLDTSFGKGPRSTPLVTDNHVYTVGITGKLHCLKRKTGKVVWFHDFMKEYDAAPPRWGYAASPLLYEGKIILPVGGEGHGVMAFHPDDGKVVWSAQDFPVAYSSPIVIDVDGQDQLVVFMADRIAGLDPNDGNQFWSHPHRTSYDVNASTPLWGDDNILFVSSAYGTGSRALKLARQGDKTTVKELWTSRKMKIHFGSAIRIGDLVYGSIGDNGPVFFGAINIKTGEMAFRQRGGLAKAQLLFADGKLVLMDENGYLAIANPTPDALELLTKAKILDRIAWTPPTMVGKTLYVRDKKSIAALELS